MDRNGEVFFHVFFWSQIQRRQIMVRSGLESRGVERTGRDWKGKEWKGKVLFLGGLMSG